MEPTRSFSSSTLTMKESSSRPYYNSSWRSRREGRQPPGLSGHRRHSDIYNNLEIFARLKESSKAESWSIIRKCIFLSPAFAFQFSTVLASVFSSTNLRLLNIQAELTFLQFVPAAVISAGFISVFSKYVPKFLTERKYYAKVMLCFSAYVFLGVSLAVASNLGVVTSIEDIAPNITEATSFMPPYMNITTKVMAYNSIEYAGTSSFNTTITENKAGLANSNALHQQVLTNGLHYPASNSSTSLFAQIAAFFGYIIMASSVSCGHYLLFGVAMSITPVDDHDRITAMEAAVGALGGCAVSFLGAADLASSWHPSHSRTHILLSHIIILLCVAAAILIFCATGSVVAFYSDTLIDWLRRDQESEDNILIARDRRPTRTAQEIFDECAALLGRPRRPSMYMEEGISTRSLPEEDYEDVSSSITQSETYIDNPNTPSHPDVTRRYQYQLPVSIAAPPAPRSCLEALKKDKTFALALLLMFVLASAVMSTENSSSVYLAYVIEDKQDKYGYGHRKWTRTASAGTFMMYLVFMVLSFFYQSIFRYLGMYRAFIYLHYMLGFVRKKIG